MAYDSEEDKKIAESIAEKTKLAKKFIRDKEAIRKIKDALNSAFPEVEKLVEIEKNGELTEEDSKLLNDFRGMLATLGQTLVDTHLLISNDLFVQSTAFFYHIKKLAEEGNEEAKKAYEDLLPDFKKAMGEGSKRPEDNN